MIELAIEVMDERGKDYCTRGDEVRHGRNGWMVWTQDIGHSPQAICPRVAELVRGPLAFAFHQILCHGYFSSLSLPLILLRPPSAFVLPIPPVFFRDRSPPPPPPPILGPSSVPFSGRNSFSVPTLLRIHLPCHCPLTELGHPFRSRRKGQQYQAEPVLDILFGPGTARVGSRTVAPPGCPDHPQFPRCRQCPSGRQVAFIGGIWAE